MCWSPGGLCRAAWRGLRLWVREGGVPFGLAREWRVISSSLCAELASMFSARSSFASCRSAQRLRRVSWASSASEVEEFKDAELTIRVRICYTRSERAVNPITLPSPTETPLKS